MKAMSKRPHNFKGLVNTLAAIAMTVTSQLATAANLPLGEFAHELGNNPSNTDVCVKGVLKTTPVNTVNYYFAVNQTYSAEKDITFYKVRVGVSLIKEIQSLVETRRAPVNGDYERACPEYISAKVMSVQALHSGQGYYYGPPKEVVSQYAIAATPQNIEVLKLLVQDLEENILKQPVALNEMKVFGEIEGADLWNVMLGSPLFDGLQQVAGILETQKSKALPGPVFRTAKPPKN